VATPRRLVPKSKPRGETNAAGEEAGETVLMTPPVMPADGPPLGGQRPSGAGAKRLGGPQSSCVPGLLAEHPGIDAEQRKRLVVALLDRRVEDDLVRGVDGDPAVAAKFLLELARGPAAVAQRDQHALGT